MLDVCGNSATGGCRKSARNGTEKRDRADFFVAQTVGSGSFIGDRRVEVIRTERNTTLV